MRKNKFILLISMLISFIFITCVSCGNAKAELESIVTNLNSKCPQSMGDIGEITSYVYYDGVLTINASVCDGIIDFNALEANKEAFKRNIIITLSNSNDTKVLIDKLAAANASLNMVYTEKKSGREYRIPISKKEITQMSQNDNQDPMEKVKAQVENAKLQCPYEWDEGMTVTNVEISGDYVVYTIKFSEKEYTIKEIRDNADILKDMQLEYYHDESNSVGRYEAKMLRDARVGVCCNYTGSQSGKVCKVVIEYNEL